MLRHIGDRWEPRIRRCAPPFEKVVVAEGVETQAQRAYLERIGVEQVQGYLFGRPALPEATGLVDRAKTAAGPQPLAASA